MSAVTSGQRSAGWVGGASDVRVVLSDPNLRRLAASWGIWVAGEWAFVVGLSVLVYAEGGVQAVGLVGAARVLPIALVAPGAATLADRFSRPRLLALVHGIWAVQLLAISLATSQHLPLSVVVAIVVLGAVASALLRPAVTALVPQLVKSPGELTAANSVYGTVEAIGTLLGPAAAGGLLAAVAPALMFPPIAVLHLLGAWVSLGVQTPFRPAREMTRSQRRSIAGLVSGFDVLLGESRARIIFGLFMAQVIMRGLLMVFLVNAALTVLGLGESGAGTLFSAIGLGGLVGAVLSPTLRADRMQAAFISGVAAWGLAVLGIGIWPNTLAALVWLGILGLGNAIEDVGGLTLLQRVIPDHQLGRAFGAFWGTASGAGALGSLLAPILISLFGLRWAMAASGCAVCALVLLGALGLSRLAEPIIPHFGLEMLSRQRIFAPLPLIALEQLARALQVRDIHRGEVVTRQGAPADTFYVIDQGVFGIWVDDGKVGELGPGDAFGETALLLQMERTATVAALTDGRLFALDGRVFVPAVTGHWGSWTAASMVADEHLARARPASMN
jgi:MFS family permease